MKQIANDIFFSWVETEIAENRPVQIRLKGTSMFPLLKEGKHQVIIHPCKADELSAMDVILFRYKGKHLLHRILKKEGDRFIIQGDGSYVAKEECTVEDVVGKVQTIIKSSGKSISVNSWRWKLPSRLWLSLTFLRTPLLRILHRIE